MTSSAWLPPVRCRPLSNPGRHRRAHRGTAWRCGRAAWYHWLVETGPVSFEVVSIDKPANMNVIIGQAHFIKTVEDLHETLAGVSPHLRFGLAFCEASAARLVRRSGNDDELTGQAAANALAIGAGHSFVILLREGFPINVLNPLKAVPEVCTIFCATANPVDVLVAVRMLCTLTRPGRRPYERGGVRRGASAEGGAAADRAGFPGADPG